MFLYISAFLYLSNSIPLPTPTGSMICTFTHQANTSAPYWSAQWRQSASARWRQTGPSSWRRVWSWRIWRRVFRTSRWCCGSCSVSWIPSSWRTHGASLWSSTLCLPSTRRPRLGRKDSNAVLPDSESRRLDIPWWKQVTTELLGMYGYFLQREAKISRNRQREMNWVWLWNKV